MLTYFILLLGTLLICTFSIRDRLRNMQRTQQFHGEWLLESLMKQTSSSEYRKYCQPVNTAPIEIPPVLMATSRS